MKYHEQQRLESAKRRVVILDKMKSEKRLFTVLELHRLSNNEGNIYYDLQSLVKEGKIKKYKKKLNHVAYYCAEFELNNIDLSPLESLYNQHCKLDNNELFQKDLKGILKEPLTRLAIESILCKKYGSKFIKKNLEKMKNDNVLKLEKRLYSLKDVS